MNTRRTEIEATLEAGGRKRHLGRWLVWIAVAAAITAGVWWLLAGGDSAAISYRTQKVMRGNLVVTVTATGTIEPLNQVEISSELSGTLTAVNADFNDTIRAGDVLATLDTTQLEAQVEVQRASHAAAAAQVTSAMSTRDEARETFETTQNLYDRGVATLSALDAAKAALDRAEAAYAVAAANRDLALANYRAQRAELDKACICSPIDGVVLDVTAEKGQIVAASLSAPTLFTIAENLTQMELLVDVAEADIGLIAEGNPATFTVEAFDDMTFPAEITQLRYASQVIEGLVTYTAVLGVENPDLLLRPGMTAVAEIEVSRVDDALLIPNAALRYAPPAEAEADDGGGGGFLSMLMPRPPDSGSTRSDGRTVWVLRAGEPVELTVETGQSDGSFTELLGGDLAEGDDLIVARITGS